MSTPPWLWVRLQPGRHSVVLSGPVGDVDSLEILFPTSPRVVEVESDGWFVAGTKDRRLLSGFLQLTRLQSEADGNSAVRWESSRFPVFARIERTLAFNIDWTVTTSVVRVAPAKGALTLEIPLLDGETVVSEGLEVRDGKILVSMNPNQGSVSWESNLPLTSPLTLQAAPTSSWSENGGDCVRMREASQ